MNLSKLFEMQRQLDERIVREKGLEGVELIRYKITALYTELGELLNEWRGFKYWSNDRKPRQQAMLKEYVDCLHFLLSIGLEMSIPEEWDLDDWDDWAFGDEIDIILTLYHEISKMDTPSDWWAVWEIFIALGKVFGFTKDDIERAYIEKNAINHERQAKGY